jgi:uncharacterized protein
LSQKSVNRGFINLHEATGEVLSMPSTLAHSLRVIWRQTRKIALAVSFFRAGLFFVKALRDPGSVATWLTFLSSFERTRGLAPARFETVTKPLGNFAVYRLSISERVALLCSHYSISAKTLPATVLSTIWSGSSIDLGYLNGKRGRRYRLTLDPAGYCYKEGECSFSLTDMADGLELARLTFSLITLGGSGERALLIGALQGPSSHSGAGAGAKTRIVAATRALSGLRPKMAVFAAASAYATATGSQSLYAVSNRTHTINADAQYQRRKMHADYDAFWIERGGTSDKLGFKMSPQIAPRSQCLRRNEQRARVAMLVYQLFGLEGENAPLFH